MNGPEINVALLRFLQNNLIKLKLQGESGDETEAQVPIRRKKVKVSYIKNKNYAVAKANNASRHTRVRSILDIPLEKRSKIPSILFIIFS